MTIEEAKARLVSWCNEQIGYHEGADNWNKYAENPDIRKLYGWNPQNQPWCEVFADDAFIECFGYDLASAMTYQYTGKGSAACATSANYYKSHNAWYAGPAVGDQVYFLVDGGINHTGIVVNVGIGAITAVEGNSSDSVARRTYPTGSPKIAGYGRPNWKLVENYEPGEIAGSPPAKPETPEPVFCTLELPELENGAIGDCVKAAQALLAGWGYTCGWYGADGEFGPATQQACINFQFARKLNPDGIIGPKTWAALLGVMAVD